MRASPMDTRLRRHFTQAASGCWEWTAYIDRDGYGRIQVNRAGYLAHRAAYETWVGTLPKHLQIDHLCRNRRCIRPSHLQPVTGLVNQRRGAPANKTHCVNGHPFDVANTYWRPATSAGRRGCRRCAADRATRFRMRKDKAA